MGCLIVTIITGLLFWFDIITAKVFMALVVGTVLWAIVASALYFWFGFLKFFYHGVLGWHMPDDSPEWNDGLSDHSVCRYCGKNIMQDSQGNWFTFE